MPDLKTRAGQVVTDEMIEALAFEAEVGYDLTQARRRDVGRPSLGSGISPRLQFRVDPATYTAAKARALAEGRTVSDLARVALEVYLRGGDHQQYGGDRSAGGDYHVVPASGRGWAVRGPGASPATRQYRTQQAARRAAVRLVRSSGGGEVIVHGADGRIRSISLVGQLPRDVSQDAEAAPERAPL